MGRRQIQPKNDDNRRWPFYSLRITSNYSSPCLMAALCQLCNDRDGIEFCLLPLDDYSIQMVSSAKRHGIRNYWFRD